MARERPKQGACAKDNDGPKSVWLSPVVGDALTFGLLWLKTTNRVSAREHNTDLELFEEYSDDDSNLRVRSTHRDPEERPLALDIVEISSDREALLSDKANTVWVKLSAKSVAAYRKKHKDRPLAVGDEIFVEDFEVVATHLGPRTKRITLLVLAFEWHPLDPTTPRQKLSSRLRPPLLSSVDAVDTGLRQLKRFREEGLSGEEMVAEQISDERLEWKQRVCGYLISQSRLHSQSQQSADTDQQKARDEYHRQRELEYIRSQEEAWAAADRDQTSSQARFATPSPSQPFETQAPLATQAPRTSSSDDDPDDYPRTSPGRTNRYQRSTADIIPPSKDEISKRQREKQNALLQILPRGNATARTDRGDTNVGRASSISLSPAPDVSNRSASLAGGVRNQDDPPPISFLDQEPPTATDNVSRVNGRSANNRTELPVLESVGKLHDTSRVLAWKDDRTVHRFGEISAGFVPITRKVMIVPKDQAEHIDKVGFWNPANSKHGHGVPPVPQSVLEALEAGPNETNPPNPEGSPSSSEPPLPTLAPATSNVEMRDPVDITNEEDEDDSFLSAWSSSPVERKTNRLPADTPGSSPGKRQKMTAQFRQQQQSSPLVKQTPYSTTKTAATTSTSFHDDGLLLQPLMESSDPVIPATCTKDSSAEQQKRSASSVIFQSRSKRALGTPDYGQAEIDVQFQNEIQHAMSSQVSLRASTQDAIAPEPPRRELFLQSQDSVLDASDPIEENNELPGAEPISSNAEAVQKSLVEEIPPPRSSVLMVEDPMEEEPMANPEPTNLNSSVENLIPQDDRTASPPSTQLMVEAEDTPVDRGSSKRPASSPTKSEELMPPPARKTSKPPQKKMRVVAPEFHFSQEKQVREDPAIGMHKFKQEYLDAMSSGSSPKPVDASQSSQSVANATEHASSPPQTQHDQDSGSTEQFAQRVPDLSSLFSNGGSLFRPGLSPPAQGSPAMSTAPGMQSTPSPTAQSIYYDFKAAYPSYAGTMSHFVSLCRKLEEARRTGKAVHKSLYDDYIFRHASEYRTHVQERMSLGEDPVPYGLWYEEEVDEPGCFKKVVNANTLEVAVDNGGEGNNDTCEAGKGKRKGRLVTSGGAASLAGSKRTHGDGSSPARRSEKRLPAQRMGTPGSEFDGNVASAENSTKKAEEQEKNKGSPVTKKPRTEKIHEPVSGLPAQSIQESSPVSPPFLGRREQQVLREKRSNTRADKVEKLQASPAEEDVEMTIVSEGGTITKGKVVTSVAAPARPKPTRVSPRTKKDSMKVAEIQRQGIEEATKKEMTKEKGMRGQIGKASPINTSTALVGTVDGGLNQNSPSPLKKRTFVEVRIPVQPRTKRQSIPWLRTEKSSQYSGGDQAKRKSERVVSSKPPTTTSTNATPTKSTNSAAKAASPLPSSRAPAKHSPHPSPTVQKQSQAPQSGIAATAKNRSTSSRLASAGSNGHNVSSPKKPTKRTQPSRESEVSEDRWWEDDSTPFRQFVKHYSKVKKVRHSAPRPPVEATDALDNTGVAKGIDGGPIDVLKWDFRSTL